MRNKMQKQQIIDILSRHRAEVANFGVNKIALFGSYARDTAGINSDIDIYISFNHGSEKYDNFIGVCYFLDKLFPDKKVEVVTEGGVSPYIEPEIKKTAVYV